MRTYVEMLGVAPVPGDNSGTSLSATECSWKRTLFDLRWIPSRRGDLWGGSLATRSLLHQSDLPLTACWFLIWQRTTLVCCIFIGWLVLIQAIGFPIA